MGFLKAVFAFLKANSFAQTLFLSFAIGKIQQRLMDEPQMQDFESSIKLNNTSNTSPIPIVYGRRRVGGSEYRGVTGNKNQFLHRCVILSEGEIDSVEQVYLNDRPADNEDIAPLLEYEVKTGVFGQTHNQKLISMSEWSPEHKGSDIAYVGAKLEYDRDVFSSGLPTLTADVKGKKVYDPRKDGTLTTYNTKVKVLDIEEIDRSALATQGGVRDIDNGQTGNPSVNSGTYTVQVFNVGSNVNLSTSIHNNTLKLTAERTTNTNGAMGIMMRFKGLKDDTKYRVTGQVRIAENTTGQVVLARVDLSDGNSDGEFASSIDESSEFQYINLEGTYDEQAGGNTNTPPSTYAFIDLGTQVTYSGTANTNIVGKLSVEFKDLEIHEIGTPTGSHRQDTQSTWEWSENPALCILDYLTSTRYGRGIPYSQIDMQSFIEEASYCDERIYNVLDRNGDTISGQKRYTCNGAINPSQSSLDNIKYLLGSCRGYLLPPSNLFKIVIDKKNTIEPVFTFDKTNIIGDWQIVGRGIREFKNKVKTRFFDKDNKYDESINIITNRDSNNNDIFKSADNGRELEAEIKLPFTNEHWRADVLGQHIMKQSRVKWTVSFTSTLEAFKVEANDVVYIKHSTMGWSEGSLSKGKLFRINTVELMAEDTIKITAEEYQDNIYSFDINQPPSIPATTLPDPHESHKPTGLTLNSNNYMLDKQGNITERIVANWSAPSHTFVSHYEIAWRERDSTSFTIVATDDTSFTIAPVNSEVTAVDTNFAVYSGVYYVKVRTVHMNGKRSSWEGGDDGLYHKVVGKLAIPSAVPNLYYNQSSDYTRQISWVEPSDPDIKGFIIKTSTNANASWDSMDILHTGLLTHSPYETRSLQAGTYKIGIRAQDTSNKLSEPTFITGIEVTDDPNIDILQAYYPRLLGWDKVGRIGQPTDDARKTLNANIPWMPSGQQDVVFTYSGQQNVLDYWGSGDDVNFAFYQSPIYNNITVVDSNGDSQPDAQTTGRWVIARSKGGNVDKYYIYFRGITSGIVTNTPYWGINTSSSHPELVPEGTYTFQGGVSGGTNPSSLTLSSDFDVNVSSVLDSPSTETINGVIHLRVKFTVSEYTHWTIQHTQNLAGSWTDIESGITGSGVTELKRSFSTSTYPSPAYFRIVGYAPNGNIVPYPATNGGVIDVLSGDIDSVAGNNAEWRDMTFDWGNWNNWGFASETLIYETYGFEFGKTITFRPIIQSTHTGTATHQIKIVPESATGTSGFSQSDYVDLSGNNNFFDPTGNITAKAIKTKTTVTGVNSTLKSLGILLDGKQQQESISSLNTANIASNLIIATGHIKIPLSTEFTALNTLQISFVGGGAGQSFEIVSKTSTDSDGKLAPTVKLYNSSGNLAHATIDITATGY